MASKKFVVLTADQLRNALIILESRLPKSSTIYNVMKLSLANRYSELVKTRFYSFDGNLNSTEKNQVFIFAVVKRKTESCELILISAADDPSEEMLHRLEETLHWSLPLMFTGVDRNFSGFVQKMCKRQGRLAVVDPCSSLTMTLSEASSLNIGSTSEIVSVKELTEDCAEKVTDRWQFSDKGTLEFMRDAISNVGSSGVFVNSELVCWVVVSAFGSMHALFCEDSHRRKGYAELCMKYCCQLMASKELIPNVHIQLKNAASKNLMGKVGLRFSHDVDWIIFEPLMTNM